ncbi:MAG: hypothetical protein JO110_00215 [Acetobacteraceae bacterium]|nr:hypothetical protein [Acetobacteraceae bacterium]
MDPTDRLPGIRPQPSFWRRLDMAARTCFPGFFTALLMVLSVAPLGLAHQAVLLAALAVGSVYFWSLARPASMPSALVFLLGLLLDVLGFLPLGVGPLCLLLTHAVALRYRLGLCMQPFLLIWLVFAGVAGCAALLQWALVSLLLFRITPPALAAFQWVIAVGLYPAIAGAFARTNRSIADPQRA